MFYGFHIDAPWPVDLPKGRILSPEQRHCTLLFLGRDNLDTIPNIPLPPFTTAPVGYFSRVYFLPPKSPHVAAWGMHWLTPGINHYQHDLETFFKKAGFSFEKRTWLPHVTLARNPEEEVVWEATFTPLPFVAKGLHLYENMGNSTYVSHWEHRFFSPFEELSHTADLAYRVFGEDLNSLYSNAVVALAFAFPCILGFLPPISRFTSHDQVIISLNKIIENTDRERGCPFKAVSFSGELTLLKNGLLSWEMIIDV